MLAVRGRNPNRDFDADGIADAFRDDAEYWFRRAMDANPDNYDACMRKLESIENDWRRGGPDALLRFGRDCAAGGNYYGRIPFVLAEAHYRAAQSDRDRDAYFRRDEVWAEIRTLYETHLSLFPDHDYYRNGYAKWAVDCGRWAEAKRLFDAIGDTGVDVRVFDGRDAFEFYRTRANEEFARLPKGTTPKPR